MDNRCYTFAGGTAGLWSVTSVRAVIGASLPAPQRLAVHHACLSDLPAGALWTLRGVTSNQRYVTRAEQTALQAVQEPPGRPEATWAALIPITKTPQWWALTQEDRREIFEGRSAHIATGLRYLPAIARRLHHCRDLGEPFDFLTWFEFAPAAVTAFEDLLAALRATEEWRYVEREVDIRLMREDGP